MTLPEWVLPNPRNLFEVDGCPDFVIAQAGGKFYFDPLIERDPFGAVILSKEKARARDRKFTFDQKL